MKNLDLNAMGVVEMDAGEMKEVDGGIWDFILGYIVGKLIDAVPDAVNASCEIKREGGTLCTDMPFK